MKKYKSAFLRILLYLATLAVFTYALFPFYWAIVTSVKKGRDLFSTDLIPEAPTLAHYKSIFLEQPFEQNIFNSVFVSTLTVGISLALGVFAAYAFARRRFRGRKALLLSFLGVSMFPQIAVLSGLFELIRALGLYNNSLGLALSYLTFTLPFTIWVLTTFMQSIPKALEEAAIMDGAKSTTIVVKIFVPLLMPSMVTTGLLAFIAAWNEFLFALTFTLSNEARTVPVAIALMSGATQHELPWGNIMAASVVVTIPLILLVLYFQRRIVSGLTAGSLKG